MALHVAQNEGQSLRRQADRLTKGLDEELHGLTFCISVEETAENNKRKPE